MTTFPTLTVQAQFTTGSWTDITTYVRQGTITRPSSRLQGPVVQYEAGTCSLTLKNTDGRFDPDNASGPYWGGTATRVATFTGADTVTFPEGVTSLTSAEVWAPGGGGGNDPSGGGNDGGGGGGGEYAKETSVAVTPLKVYTIPALTAGAGGAASSSTQHDGSAGVDVSIVFDAVTLNAHGGKGGKAGAGGGGTAGAAGTGSPNATHHDGGAGAAGTTGHGGGGGSGAGTGAAGNAASGSTGGVAPTGGGPGGNGGTSTQKNGGTPASGPGGGGGGGDNGAGGAGQGGQVKLTYTVSTAQTQVLPMVPIQVQATWNAVTYTLFTGYVDAWTDDGANYAGNYDEVTIQATDAFKVFTNVTLAALGSPAGAGEDSGARVNRILDAAAWSPTARAITTGDSTVQATSFDDTVMSLLQLTADTELGELYVDGSGNLTFRHRLGLISDSRSSTPQGVFGDSPGTVQTAGTELAYTQVSRAEDDTTLVNDAQITIAGSSNLQEATDSDSIAKYLYPRTYQRTDLLLQSDSDGLNYAQWIVYIGGGAENRFETLTVTPAVDATNLFPQVLGREFGDRIEVWRRPPNVSAISKDCFIRGITHSFTPLFWQTQWTLQSASKYGSFLTLDDATLGQLNNNALAY